MLAVEIPRRRAVMPDVSPLPDPAAPLAPELVHGWYCERCEQPVGGISDEVDTDKPQRCPHCKHHTVIWMTPERFAERLGSHFAGVPPKAVKDELGATSVTPAAVKATRETARDWFAKMRAAVSQAVDFHPTEAAPSAAHPAPSATPVTPTGPDTTSSHRPVG